MGSDKDKGGGGTGLECSDVCVDVGGRQGSQGNCGDYHKYYI